MSYRWVGKDTCVISLDSWEAYWLGNEELCNMLVNPIHTAFSLSWHRDAIPEDATEEEEARMLKIPNFGTQWNTALVDDECLEVVPGSHSRVRTEAERRGEIQGIKVVLKAGDTVFYDHNILHRAVYPTARRGGRCMHAWDQRGLRRSDGRLFYNMEWDGRRVPSSRMRGWRN